VLEGLGDLFEIAMLLTVVGIGLTIYSLVRYGLMATLGGLAGLALIIAIFWNSAKPSRPAVEYREVDRAGRCELLV
jgi:hypothetical protein